LNRQDAKSAKVLLLFLLPFAAFAPLRFKSPGPPKQAVHELGTNASGPSSRASVGFIAEAKGAER